MLRILIFKLRRRRAVSTLIGGVIVLSLLLTALGTMVFVSQQYDQYQQAANRMTQLRNQQLSEDLVAISPGLTVVNSTTGTISGWGSGCGISTANPEYNCYNATISNLGTVGVQIVRIYINSTGLAGSGCSSPNPQPCILNPTSSISSYAFNQANLFLNPGETNHQVILALPTGVALPDPTPAFPQNSVVIVTSRGNVFSFQWPFQVSVFGQSQSAFSSGNMKVAYQGGFDSSKEPSFTGKAATGYCHTEQAEPYPAAAGHAEELTGITGVGVTGNTLYFVNPWITGGNNQAVVSSSGALYSGTTLYIYVVIINTGSTAYAPTAGSLDLMWYGSNHIDAYLLGVYYNSAFYVTSPTIPPGAYYYAIFKVTIFMMDNPGWVVQPGSPSVMWWGSAAITNALNGSSESSENQSFFSGTILVSGLWIRYEAASGSCT
jgi:hypothetical protein